MTKKEKFTTDYLLKLFHRLRELGAHGFLKINVNSIGNFNYNLSIHASKDILSKVMSECVFSTGIFLKKRVTMNWQDAYGEIANLVAYFYPTENKFKGCKLIKKTRKVKVLAKPAQPAQPEHFKDETYYEAECDGFKMGVEG